MSRHKQRSLTSRAVVPLLLVAVTGVVGLSGWARPTGAPGKDVTASLSSSPEAVAPGLGASALPSPSAEAPSKSPSATPSRTARARAAELELPRGGTQLFPRYRLVGYSGGPGSAAFGRLGVGRLDDRAREIERRAAAYRSGREPLPVLELITVVAQAKPGPDRRYRLRVKDEVIQTHLAAARRHRALLLLNVQPGRARFLDEVRGLERWLREPDVGVALDPEWAVGPRQVPGRVYGSTTGKELDGVAEYLASLVRTQRLPQKAMVVHQLAPRIVKDFGDVGRHRGVAVIQSVDGIGARADKERTWERIVATLPAGVHPGFKLFFEEDAQLGALMTPEQVLALHPQPEYVLYE